MSFPETASAEDVIDQPARALLSTAVTQTSSESRSSANSASPAMNVSSVFKEQHQTHIHADWVWAPGIGGGALRRL